MSTPEDRLAALEQWQASTVDPALQQAKQALTNQAGRIATLERAGAKLDARLTKVVNLLKRVGPSIKDILGIIATQAANKDAQLPRDERKRRAKIREEVLGSDFNLDDSDGA